jgi:ABC-2 type transport system permease protein
MFLTRRLLDLPIIKRSNALRTFFVAAWLGWQIESNWTDPLLFAIYSIARPISSILILVVMYSVITNGATEQPIFAYIYLGNALYILVGQVITGVSWSVVDDRERYRTMKQLHTAPINSYAYLLGRGIAKLLVASVSVLITITFGLIAFHLPITFAMINWPLFVVSTLLGIVSLACIGTLIGGISLMTARHFDALGDATAGAMYLFTGAIFPLDVLPALLRPIGLIFPVTYWLELARRDLLGPNAAKFPTLAAFSDTQLTLILLGITLVLIVVSRVGYRWLLHHAKERGMIDMETAY